MLIVNDVEPPELLAYIVYVLIAGIDNVGVPYKVPFVGPKNNPVGSAG